MTFRSLRTAAVALLVGAPLSAQMAGMNHDADKKTEGGALPAGWSMRKDKPTAPDAKLAPMGTGVHVTSGGAAIYWREKDRPSVPFTATASFTQTKAPMHPEAYGLFYMGNKLAGAEQSYAYLLVRGDGKVMVKHRAGAELHTILDWTENAAVHKQDADGKATNTLSVAASADSTRLMVNGVQVIAIGGAYAKADGHVGLRVNHNLDVHVDNFTVSSDGPAAPKSAGQMKKMKKMKTGAKAY